MSGHATGSTEARIRCDARGLEASDDQGGRDAPGSGVYGAEINSLDSAALLSRYTEAGFLYPAKRARLQAHWPTILDNWERVASAGEALRRTYHWRSPDGRRWATVDTWRSAATVWTVQHLVANGGGVGARAVMLAALARGGVGTRLTAADAWFRPDNPYPAALFGSSVKKLGPFAGLSVQRYFAVPTTVTSDGRYHIACCTEPLDDVLTLAVTERHPLFTTSIALKEDPQLDAADQLYRRVGLRRYRRIFLARDRAGSLLGVALAHRGPLGLNLSFLENRCDLILDRHHHADPASVAAALVAAATDTYDDLPIGYLPVAIALSDTQSNRQSLIETIGARLGATVLRDYAQVGWAPEALASLAGHIDAATSVHGTAVATAGRS